PDSAASPLTQSLRRKPCRGTSQSVFFSSSRRHTRSKRDWSSDVCSSDLGANGRGVFKLCCNFYRGESAFCKPRRVILFLYQFVRSEERRVGREGRLRRRPDHEEGNGAQTALDRSVASERRPRAARAS